MKEMFKSDSGVSSVTSSVCMKSHRSVVDVRGTFESATPSNFYVSAH